MIETDRSKIEIGLQCPSDSEFKARMRYHQSRYRANILKVNCGVGPNESSKTKYGNMLSIEDGQKGLNFLSPKIFHVALKRISENCGVVESYRLLNNMLSSQPLCFNLFGLMDDDLRLATDFWNVHFPNRVKKITSVKFEYAPAPKESFLNDRTAFDVYFEYKNFSGENGFIGIEMKYTEPFSQKFYDPPSYRKWSNNPESPWKQESYGELSNIKWNQLWRDHLLVISILNQNDSKFKEGFLLLIRHPEDNECEKIVAMYKSFLKDDDKTFYNLPLDLLLAAYANFIMSDETKQWLEKFKERYLIQD